MAQALGDRRGYSDEERARLTPAGLARLTVPKWKVLPITSLINKVFMLVATASLRPRDSAYDKWRRVVLAVPPRGGKSEICSINGPAWYLGHNPDNMVGVASYEATFAEGFGALARNALSQHGVKVFGVVTDPSSEAKDWWGTLDYRSGRICRGGMRAMGWQGPMIGKGFNLLDIDDITKNAAEALSSTHREGIWNWWQATAKTRMEPGGAVLIVQQRWHEDDLPGRVIREEGLFDDVGLGGWNPIIVPLRAEPITNAHVPGLGDRTLPDPLGREPGEMLLTRFDPSELEARERTTPAFWWNCTPTETPILMADWTTKPISEVRVGDSVIGFETGTKEHRARLRVSRVLDVATLSGRVCDIEMASGRVIRSTADHRWYVRYRGGQDAARDPYLPPKVGRTLRYVCPIDPEPTERERHLWAWLAGIVDGEGSVQPNTLSISQSLTKNRVVVERIEAALTELGIGYSRFVRKQTNPKWSDTVIFQIRDPRTVYRKLIRFGGAAKADQMAARLIERGGWFGRETDSIVSITPGEHEEPVYGLTTETGNYVAWGYASSNSQYQQRPAAEQGALFQKTSLRYYEILPDYFRLQKAGVNWLVGRSDIMVFATTDLAASLKTRADYFAVGLWGVTRNRDLLLLDVVRGKFEGPDQDDILKGIWRMGWGGLRPSFVAIESTAYQLTMVQRMRRAGIAVRPVQADRDKYSRAVVAATRMNSEGIFLPAAPTPWKTDYITEHLSFPNAQHDDLVDMTAYACICIEPSATGQTANIRVLR